MVRPVLWPFGRVVQAVGGVGSPALPQPSSPQEVYIRDTFTVGHF